MQQPRRWIITLICILLFGLEVLAGQVITLRRGIEVFNDPDKPESHSIKPKSKIEIVRTEDGWTFIKYKRGGKIKTGWVLEDDLALAQAPSKSKKEKKPKQLMFISGVYSLDRQGKREVQTTADTIYDINDFMGSTTFFEVGMNYQFSDDWWTRAGIAKRVIVLEGDAKVRDSTTASTELKLTQEFFSFQIGALYKPVDWKKLSMYGFFEMAKGTSTKLEVLSGLPLDETNIETTTHILLIGGFDYELWRSGNFMTGTLFRGGSMITADPVVILFETGIQVGYNF